MPKHKQLSNALKGMGVRAGQRLQLDAPEPEPKPVPVAALVVAAPEDVASEPDAESPLELEPVSLTAAPVQQQLSPAEPRRRGKKSSEQAQQAVNTKHMGTIETPYVRQRDNTPTRKVSVILPVDLARELQLHCVQTGQRTNTFCEDALRAALARANGRGAGAAKAR